VTFAGNAASTRAVTIDHGTGLVTTYSNLSEVSVRAGEAVSAGTWIGRVGSAHQGTDGGLHFGAKQDGVYVDPRLYLGPIDTGSAIHLAPLRWRAAEAAGAHFDRGLQVRTAGEVCNDYAVGLPANPRAPNDNVAVAVAGIGSRTAGGVRAEMYEHGPEELGYPEDRVYPYSYRGTDGPHLHEPYDPADTWGDIRRAAQGLGALLEKIGAEHPGAAVDLIAHSQGGIVARTYLAQIAEAWNPRVPPVRHLVTFSSPHQGAPIAGVVEPLEERTLTGRHLLDRVGAWSRSGGPIPDPRATAVAQLAPGSELLTELAREDLVFGVRGLALSIPHDVVVPADRAALPEELNRAVPPVGLNGHGSIVGSARALTLAHAFLRDGADPCRTGWDTWAPRFGRLIGAAEIRAPKMLAAGEAAVIRRLLALLVP
jgi:hypothetical protein